MKDKYNIFRFTKLSKHPFDKDFPEFIDQRFDAKSNNVYIGRIEIRWDKKGQIEKVDIFYSGKLPKNGEIENE